MFNKKKPKRLYYPTKARWYTPPRRRSRKRPTQKVFVGAVRNRFSKYLKSSVYVSALVLLFLTLILFLFLSSRFAITNIEVARESFNIDSAAITAGLNEYIGKNILFLPSSRIRKNIQEAFPEFANVQVNKILPNKIQIRLATLRVRRVFSDFYGRVPIVNGNSCC